MIYSPLLILVTQDIFFTSSTLYFHSPELSKQYILMPFFFLFFSETDKMEVDSPVVPASLGSQQVP